MASNVSPVVHKALQDKVWQTGWTYIRNVVDTAREPFLILDDKLTVLTANESFLRTFDVLEKDTIGKYVYDLGDGQWAGKHLRTLLDKILPKQSFFRDFEVDYNFPGIGRKIVLLNARRVYIEEEGLPKLIILAMEDVTRQRTIELKLSDYAKELEAKVGERTEELTKRIEQLEVVNKLIVSRELKMVELKGEIENLKKEIKKLQK
ncbi:MAG: PAS domain-containing protein [bacterium]